MYEQKESFNHRMFALNNTKCTYNITSSGRQLYLECSETRFPFKGAVLALISISGFLFNMFLLLSILPNRRLRNIRHLFLVHLAFNGIATSILISGISSVSFLTCKWIGGCSFCRIYAYVFTVFIFTSVWTIAGLSWDKYQTIASPLHHSQTATVARLGTYIAILWFIACFLSFPVLMGNYILRQDMAMCTVNALYGTKWYVLFYILLWYFVPLIVVSYCYFHIFRIARSQSSRIAASMIKMGSLIQAPIKITQSKNLSIKGRRAMGTITHIIGAFTITFMPFALTMCLETFSQHEVNGIVASVVSSLIQAAPLTNAVVYGLRNSILRESFVGFMSRRSADANEVRNKRRGSILSLPPRPSSTLHLSVLLRRCAAGQNLFVRPTSSHPQAFNPSIPCRARSALDIVSNYNRGAKHQINHPVILDALQNTKKNTTICIPLEKNMEHSKCSSV